MSIDKPALLVVDIQNGFIDEAELPVPGDREVIPIINRLMPWNARLFLGWVDRKNQEKVSAFIGGIV